MRGKPLSLEWALAWRGITPADAGKTPETVMKWWLEKDHPRGCGENISKAVDFGGERGSPPRMRGKQILPTPRFCLNRITPADAGKTEIAPFEPFRRRDHPRGCGENLYRLRRWSRGRGSPPRMRGKRFSRFRKTSRHGITPADAGKTMVSRL